MLYRGIALFCLVALNFGIAKAFNLDDSAEGTEASKKKGSIQIAVAANFYQPLKHLLTDFSSDIPINLHFASSGLLFAQIAQGAPIDLFLSADTHYTQALVNRGKAEPGSQAVYACGVLALWSRQGFEQDRKAGAVAGKMRRSHSGRTLAIANPKTAPYGKAALTVIEKYPYLGEKKQIRAPNVAASFQYVHVGAVDAGFVALAQLKEKAVPHEQIWEVPATDYLPIQQAMVMTKGAAQSKAVANLHAYLLSAKVQEQLISLGYRPARDC